MQILYEYKVDENKLRRNEVLVYWSSIQNRVGEQLRHPLGPEAHTQETYPHLATSPCRTGRHRGQFPQDEQMVLERSAVST